MSGRVHTKSKGMGRERRLEGEMRRAEGERKKKRGRREHRKENESDDRF